MRSPILALTWHFGYRHRLGLAVVAAYLLGCAALVAALPTGSFGPKDGFLLSMQFVFGVIYVAAVFAYGFDGPVERRESGFPTRLFTLPVRTAVLVGWPMILGPLTVALLWAAWCHFVLAPVGLEVAPGLAGLTVASFVACMQALLWSPFGLPWARVLVALPVLTAVAVAPLLGSSYGVPEAALAGVLAALIPAAFLAAFTGVSRARCGDVPAWGEWLRPGLAALRRLWPRAAAREPRPFTSAARAQLWFEWRCHGRAFPLVVGGSLALLLAFVFWIEPRPENKIGVGWNLLYLPCVLAGLQGSFMGRAGSAGKLGLEMSAFNATRPLTCAAVVAAKLKAAALSTLAAWALVAVAALVWLLNTGAYERVPGMWERLVGVLGPVQASAVLLLAVAGPVLLTWALIAGQLFLGLTGRVWVMYGFGALALAGLLGAAWTLSPGAEWLRDRAAALTVIAWVGAAVVALKLLLAGWAVRALSRRGLVERATLARLLGVWLLAVLGLFALLMWLVPAEAVAPYLLALWAVLCVPLARLAFAPLALAWNRHR
jgi:hypothetical protein